MNTYRDKGECCGMCARFTRQGHAEQAEQGGGWCTGYERHVRASDAPSVLFNPAPASQVAERQAFLEKHQEAA